MMVIKIFGGTGEGKTTLARLLEETLRDFGFSVQNEDVDRDQLESRRYQENLAVMKEAASKGDRLSIEIKTIPYARETLPNYALEFQKRLQKGEGSS